MTDRDEYVAKLKAQIDEWNAGIAKWEAKASEAQAGARAEYEKQLQSLRQHRDQVTYQAKLMQNAANDAWTDVMRGADEAWTRMREAFEKAGTHFKGK